MNTFNNIKAEIIGISSSPINESVASAKTCYSSKGVVLPEDTEKRSVKERIFQQLFNAGHHTTIQHTYITFCLDNITRKLVWKYIHSHPFYNSEQVSQRYVEQSNMNSMPNFEFEKSKELFENVVETQMRVYNDIIQALIPLTTDYLSALAIPKKKIKSLAKKKAMEQARYVLPIATQTYMHHTISFLDMLRYYKISMMENDPEFRILTKKMINSLKKRLNKEDISILNTILDTIKKETKEYTVSSQNIDVAKSKRFIKEFDDSLEGRVSKMVSHTPNPDKVISHMVRQVLGDYSLQDEDAIKILFDSLPLESSMNTMLNTDLGRALTSIYFTFNKKISISADSQNQRHRRLPEIRTGLISQYSREPDYITPSLISQDSKANELYTQIMGMTWENVNKLLDAGEEPTQAFYLLPNSLSIRLSESGDFAAFLHKSRMRLCLNAQEEIWRSMMDECEQIKEVSPIMGGYLGAPCQINYQKGVRPFCPENSNFCGVSVWKKGLPEKDERFI